MILISQISELLYPRILIKGVYPDLPILSIVTGLQASYFRQSGKVIVVYSKRSKNLLVVMFPIFIFLGEHCRLICKKLTPDLPNLVVLIISCSFVSSILFVKRQIIFIQGLSLSLTMVVGLTMAIILLQRIGGNWVLVRSIGSSVELGSSMSRHRDITQVSFSEFIMCGCHVLNKL